MTPNDIKLPSLVLKGLSTSMAQFSQVGVLEEGFRYMKIVVEFTCVQLCGS